MRKGYFKNYPHTAYGFIYEKRHVVGQVGTQWILIIYFYKWFRAFSNHPIYL
jgi:hypothetical protein